MGLETMPTWERIALMFKWASHDAQGNTIKYPWWTFQHIFLMRYGLENIVVRGEIVVEEIGNGYRTYFYIFLRIHTIIDCKERFRVQNTKHRGWQKKEKKGQPLATNQNKTCKGTKDDSLDKKRIGAMFK